MTINRPAAMETENIRARRTLSRNKKSGHRRIMNQTTRGNEQQKCSYESCELLRRPHSQNRF